MTFRPKRVFFEQAALEYHLGKELLSRFRTENIPVSIIGSHNRVTGIPGKTPQEAFYEAKSTLVFGVRKTLDFETCKPSAHFQLPLATGCGGKCEYCYLMTTLGKKPYLRAYVNLDEILARAREYIVRRAPDITVFEGAATSDPIPAEQYTCALAHTIRFFADEELGRFRFVTKFTDIDPLLNINHNGHSVIRFSINTEQVIKQYEHGTPALIERIRAANKAVSAGFPTGFIVAPIFSYANCLEDYRNLLNLIRSEFSVDPYSFEFITHRFTARARTRILEVFPTTTLPLAEEGRKYKYGQFGYGKYIYPPELFNELKTALTTHTQQLFPTSRLEYFV